MGSSSLSRNRTKDSCIGSIASEPPGKSQDIYFFSFFSILFWYKFIYFNWRLITLQYCIGFARHQHESTTCVHKFPLLNPLSSPSPYHPCGLSQCTNPKHPVSCIEPRLAICFLYDIIHVSVPRSQIVFLFELMTFHSSILWFPSFFSLCVYCMFLLCGFFKA